MQIVLPKPNPKQELFLLEKHPHVAFGGARGGGKSFVVRMKAIILALFFAGIKIMIVRKSYPELLANHVKPLKTMLKIGTKDACAKYNDSKKEITFPNGSEILFRYCDTEGDVDRYQGTEVDILFLDEATQLSEEQIKKICACVRGVNSFPKRTYYTCNPGGRGHGYIKRLFIDRQFETGEDPKDYAFIQSLVTDNKALMESNPEYIKRLEALPPKLKKAWLEGCWDVYEGQVFEEFRNDGTHYEDRCYTHVISPFTPPKEWKIWRSFDFGYSKPFSCAWWAVDYDGRIYRILELYGCVKNEPDTGVKWNPDEIFKEIARIENEHDWLKGKRIQGVADPAIWEKSHGVSIAETGEKYGVYFDKGDHKRLAGWMQVHYRMKFDENGKPMMYIFSNCKAFIRTIPTLMYDDHKPEDIDTKMEDHVADETRYLCMANPMKPIEVEDRTPAVYNPLEDNDIKADRYAFYRKY